MKVLGENSLLPIFQSSFKGRKGLSAPGDDCAILTPPPGRKLVQTCDQVVEGMHVPEGCPPEVMAVKLVRRSLSDLAAAGAEPWAASWTIVAPRDKGGGWMTSLVGAFLEEAAAFNMGVVGGDVSNGRETVLTCTLLGLEGRRPAPGRGGARPGDEIWATGTLGGAVESGRHLKPEPRLREGRRLNEVHHARAMMDLSDGLAADLPRLLQASSVGAEIILEDLPLDSSLKSDLQGWEKAAGDGEDYELLAVLGPRRGLGAEKDPVLQSCGLTRIGRIVEGQGVDWIGEGKAIHFNPRGWESCWE